MKQALYDTDGIAAVRYPKGGEPAALAEYVPTTAPYVYDEDGRDVLVVTYGRTYGTVKMVCDRLRQQGRALSVLKLNRVLPLPEDVVSLAKEYRCVLVAEEARSGVGDLLGSRLMQSGFAGRYGVRSIEETLGACTTEQGLQQVGLDETGIEAWIQACSEGL